MTMYNLVNDRLFGFYAMVTGHVRGRLHALSAAVQITQTDINIFMGFPTRSRTRD